MKNGHVGLIVLAVGVGLLYFMYKFTGAASNCSFLDAIMGKCGTS